MSALGSISSPTWCQDNWLRHKGLACAARCQVPLDARNRRLVTCGTLRAHGWDKQHSATNRSDNCTSTHAHTRAHTRAHTHARAHTRRRALIILVPLMLKGYSAVLKGYSLGTRWAL